MKSCLKWLSSSCRCHALIAEAGNNTLVACLRSGSALSELYVAVDELEVRKRASQLGGAGPSSSKWVNKTQLYVKFSHLDMGDI